MKSINVNRKNLEKERMMPPLSRSKPQNTMQNNNALLRVRNTSQRTNNMYVQDTNNGRRANKISVQWFQIIRIRKHPRKSNMTKIDQNHLKSVLESASFPLYNSRRREGLETIHFHLEQKHQYPTCSESKQKPTMRVLPPPAPNPLPLFPRPRLLFLPPKPRRDGPGDSMNC